MISIKESKYKPPKQERVDDNDDDGEDEDYYDDDDNFVENYSERTVGKISVP